MRILCLFFPRLAIELACRERPELRGRPLVLTSHAGDRGLVVAAAATVTACGVHVGMSAAEAQRHAPGSTFAPDNAAACYDEMDRVARLLRLRATPLLELGGRDHIFVDTAGLIGDEAQLAACLSSIASAWSGLRVQAAVAPGRAEALRAARVARRGPVVLEGTSAGAEQPVRDRGDEVISARARCALRPGMQPLVRLQELLKRLDSVLDGRGQAAREVRVLGNGPGAPLQLRLRPELPLARASEALPILRERLGDLAEVEVLTVELARLVPAPAPQLATLDRRGAAAGAQEAPMERQALRAAG